MSIGIVVAPPLICGDADVELAHRLMQAHRACRIDRCAWKLAAYHTLVVYGRIVPQTRSPRERAAERKISFPPMEDDNTFPECTFPSQTLRQVLDQLNRLSPEQRPEAGPPLEGM
ncbi:hypothetical protein [Nocardia sp. R6R-6]|uniref:hypothetical protein n=1 Tax=Nocardia sp. R6R-6 TaxID=3459303 RepID=UPI00403DBF9E